MTCTDALRLLLEADPGVLAEAGSHDSDLARHLSTCARCRTAADRILEADATLRLGLAVPAPDAVEATRRARAEAERRQRQRRRVWQAGTPLAAAAVLAGILVMRHGEGGGPGMTAAPAHAATGYRGVTVKAPPGRNVAVLNSDSSDVVVIWFF
ncbi:MAG TPA: hypothetical protein VMH88_06710 [Gemmatimonadales bacterium]|nr:hypothetical protein [Gemmatimonadales bacterium]